MNSQGRTRLLEEALHLFLEKSYGRATIDELAERAELSKGLVFYHFGSKAGLLAEVIEPFLSGLQDLIEQHEGLPQDGNADEVLGDYFDLIVDHLDTFRLISLDSSLANESKVGERVDALRARLRSLLSADDVASSAALGVFVNPLQQLADLPPTAWRRNRQDLLEAARLALETTTA